MFGPWHWAAFLVLTALVAFVAIGTGQWWLDHRGGGGVAFAVLSLLLAGSLVVFATRWLSLPLMRRPGAPPGCGAPVGMRVGVATTYVPAAEPLDMLERTVAALVAMAGDHDTWVLDEGDGPEVRALCDRLGALHFTRRGVDRYQQPSGRFAQRTKHGNYNAWLDAHGYDRYELVVNFDPDHVPRASFLERTLGYFADPEIGYVQAAQVYYNQPASFVARGAAEETYIYYSAIQMAGYALGYPVVTGCHTAHRVTALEQVGGFADHEADDLLITILYRAARWRGVYVPERLAAGLTPVDWSAYLRQQRRWARSLLHIKFRIFPRIAARLSPVDWMVSATHGLYYLYGVGMLTGVVLLAALLLTGDVPDVLSSEGLTRLLLLTATFQACHLYRQAFLLEFRSEWGLYLRAGVLRWAKWPTMIAAIADAFRSNLGSYAVTPKRHASGKPRGGFVAVHLATGTLLVIAWAIGVVLGHPAPQPLLLVSAAVVVASLGVVASTRLPMPAPYDDALAQRRLEETMGAGGFETPISRV